MNAVFSRASKAFAAFPDAGTAYLFPMLIPSVGAKLFGLRRYSRGADYRYAMNLAASLMLGWTLLLLWTAPDRSNAVRSLG